MSVVEICAGAGGQSRGLELAGFDHAAAIELDFDAANTLRLNRPAWNILTEDVRNFSGTPFRGVDLLAGGVPCPPFSVAGKQLGADDERDLFPEALRLVEEIRPSAVMLENVKGLSSKRFTDYRNAIISRLDELGYSSSWKLIYSSEFGVPQLRPRFILVAFLNDRLRDFAWPSPLSATRTVGDTLLPLMSSRGWPGASDWAHNAQSISPTIVGGSKKHGGADLGPTRAKAGWAALGVDGKGIADFAPDEETPHDHIPRLTNQMVARIQGFDSNWAFSGKKTSVYRQIGNAFPPPVAMTMGTAISIALGATVSAKKELRLVS